MHYCRPCFLCFSGSRILLCNIAQAIRRAGNFDFCVLYAFEEESLDLLMVGLDCAPGLVIRVPNAFTREPSAIAGIGIEGGDAEARGGSLTESASERLPRSAAAAAPGGVGTTISGATAGSGSTSASADASDGAGAADDGKSEVEKILAAAAVERARAEEESRRELAYSTSGPGYASRARAAAAAAAQSAAAAAQRTAALSAAAAALDAPRDAVARQARVI